MQRLKSGLWVAAYIRRLAHEGVTAVVLRHGADDAGAIFVKVARLDGTADLYGPAPQAFFDADDSGERRFERIFQGVPESDAEARIGRERGFDPDLWAVEVEDRHGRHFLELAGEPRPDPFAGLFRR
ncbi:DUF1491 family protein [Prosthecomicrobium sp. N25]|uniref:DUF1491 family protein n=1 Tax=Prosthecomicrobium sp. N25 TaxID=3129254 RepID=UPI003076D839